MYEVELKASISGREGQVEASLATLASGAKASYTYQDLYLDTQTRDLASSGRELRIRTVFREGAVQAVTLTYKDAPFDSATNSKPEYEVRLPSSEVLQLVLEKIGFTRDVEFIKHCTNYSLMMDGHDILATICTLDEVAGTFLELEILVSAIGETPGAKAVLFSLLRQIEIPVRDLTVEAYVDLVRNARNAPID